MDTSNETPRPWEDPAQHRSEPCALCDAPAADAVVVGTRGRFGIDVRNVACRRCGLVRVDPRPTPEALDAYYRGPYREQVKNVKLPLPGGGSVGPDDPGYLEARRQRYIDQARIALRLGDLEPGARVLEVGCRDGQTLMHMRELGGVEVYGVEPGPAEAQQARDRGVDVFTGLLEELELGPDGGAPSFPTGLDQVQMFHVLEHIHQPLAVLVHLRSWLAPGGRVLIEVPNVTHPYGPLDANFFQNCHLTSFSANTLCAMMERAGLAPTRLVDKGTLFVVGVRDPARDGVALPLPFEEAMLPSPQMTGEWIADRLDTYRYVERAKAVILSGTITMDHLSTMASLLQRPAFADHTRDTVQRLVEWLLRVQAQRAASAIARAAAAGPHAASVAATCQALALQCARPPSQTPVMSRRPR